MKPEKIITKAIAAGAAVTSAAIVAKKANDIKDKKFCPLCTAKKILNKTRINQTSADVYSNGVAMTPPMGWSSWNLFRNHISEDLIKEIADAMAASGLAEAGYKYVNIDDCWQASERDADGKLQADPIHFRSGMKALSEYVNSKGLKLGIYSSNGTLTCEDYPASLRHEAVDADTFAEWGVEYFKYDFCHNEKISSEAPKIAEISVFSKECDKVIASYSPYDFTLRKMARIVPEKKIVNGAYVDGLDSRNGSIAFNVESDQTGIYNLSFTYRKNGLKDKFALIKINDCKEYHLYIPGTKGFTVEGKAHIDVELTEGINTIEISNPIGSYMDSAAVQYTLMGRELKRATKEFAEKNGTEEKPIVYSLCEWGMNRPWKWGRNAGNLWRTTHDIIAAWPSILGIYEFNVRLYKYAGKGCWNDPDMLEVGNGKLTYEENKSHFSLWCMMCAPLILGNDIRAFIKEDGSVDKDSKVYKILTDKDMIGINQDSLGVQCKRIKFGLTDVLIKPLENSKAAVLVLNKGVKSVSEKLDFAKISNDALLNLPKKDTYKIFDVWEKSVIEGISVINTEIPSHGVKVYIVE